MVMFISWSFKKHFHYKSSRLQMFFKIRVVKNFAIFGGKDLCWSYFKVLDPEAYNFIKKRLQHRCFLVNIAKFLRAPILKKICERLLLQVWIQICYVWFAFVNEFEFTLMEMNGRTWTLKFGGSNFSEIC